MAVGPIADGVDPFGRHVCPASHDGISVKS
jgi:hypothetical protein